MNNELKVFLISFGVLTCTGIVYLLAEYWQYMPWVQRYYQKIIESIQSTLHKFCIEYIPKNYKKYITYKDARCFRDESFTGIIIVWDKINDKYAVRWIDSLKTFMRYGLKSIVNECGLKIIENSLNNDCEFYYIRMNVNQSKIITTYLQWFFYKNNKQFIEKKIKYKNINKRTKQEVHILFNDYLSDGSKDSKSNKNINNIIVDSTKENFKIHKTNEIRNSFFKTMDSFAKSYIPNNFIQINGWNNLLKFKKTRFSCVIVIYNKQTDRYYTTFSSDFYYFMKYNAKTKRINNFIDKDIKKYDESDWIFWIIKIDYKRAKFLSSYLFEHFVDKGNSYNFNSQGIRDFDATLLEELRCLFE